MSKIVHITWLNPNQRVDLYPAVLDGMEIQDRLHRPTAEYFFVATSEEAEELKARMDRHIPKKSYTVVDENSEPVGGVVNEPEITILDIP